jgi:hypothetical protein
MKEPKTITAEKYLDQFDKLYAYARNEKLIWHDPKWAVPVRSLNIMLRNSTKLATGYEAQGLKYCFKYFTLKLQLFKSHAKNSLFGRSKRKRLARQAKRCRILALNPKADIEI